MTIYSCVLFYSLLNGLNPQVTQAVIQIESSGNPLALGRSHKEVGLMQIRPEFVPESPLQLFQPCTNIKRGTKILGELKRKCYMCIDKTWINAYNLGITGSRKLKYPAKFPYHRKILAKLGQNEL